MSWASFWIARARRAATRRKERYGLAPPARLERIAQRDDGRLSLVESLWLLLYVIVGSPGQVLRVLWWHLTDRDTPRRKRRVGELARDLRARLSPGCRVLAGYFERRLYSRDVARVPRALEKSLHRTTPLLVVQPRTEQDIRSALLFCTERRIPVYPRGVSSSPFGGAVPTTNGVVLDLSPMMRVLEIDPERRLARVEPGVRWADLDRRLERHGLALHTSPTSRFSTVGGWVSTGGLGIGGFGYGHLSQHIAAARVVLPAGEILALADDDPRMGLFSGTEGNLGVISEVTLRVRPRPTFSRSHLLYFDGVKPALELVDRLAREAPGGPEHVAFYSSDRMAEENRLFAHRFCTDKPIVQERDAVLIHFDDEAAEERFVRSFAAELGRADPGPGAAYLWSERFFPLKAQRIGPSLLAAEVVLGRRAVARFMTRGRRLARRFGSPLAFEVFFSRGEEGLRCVTIGSFTCDARHRVDYLLRLLLVQLLTRRAVKLGGHPYGFGIWNSPFVTRRFPRRQRLELLRHKRQYDPQLMLNPMKLFRVRLRITVPGVLFLGPVYQAALFTADLLSPLLGLLARATRPRGPHDWTVPSPEAEQGYSLLADTILRCTFCGACISTCPAYLLTTDELVTGRAKLRLADALIGKEEVEPREAHSPFQCLRCGLCEEVCQTRLPLRDCYDVVERWVQERHGHPIGLVQSFAATVDARRQRVAEVYGITLPAWSPPEGPYTSLPDGPAPGTDATPGEAR